MEELSNRWRNCLTAVIGEEELQKRELEEKMMLSTVLVRGGVALPAWKKKKCRGRRMSTSEENRGRMQLLLQVLAERGEIDEAAGVAGLERRSCWSVGQSWEPRRWLSELHAKAGNRTVTVEERLRGGLELHYREKCSGWQVWEEEEAAMVVLPWRRAGWLVTGGHAKGGGSWFSREQADEKLESESGDSTGEGRKWGKKNASF